MYGAQYKFPRVLKGKIKADWLEYLADLEPKTNHWYLIG